MIRVATTRRSEKGRRLVGRSAAARHAKATCSSHRSIGAVLDIGSTIRPASETNSELPMSRPHPERLPTLPPLPRTVSAADLIASTLTRLRARGGRSPLRSLEWSLAEAVGARSVSIGDAGAWTTGPVAVGHDAVAARVPLPAGDGVLVALPEAGRAFGVADFDLLRTGAALAALVSHLDTPGIPTLTATRGAASTEAPALVGSSAPMRALRRQIERVARTDFTIVVDGESGAGKELVARQIHAASARASGPFVAVNCAALVESLIEAELFGIEDRTATGVRGRRGKFELADGGTLFLDEIADLSPQGQAKFLRVLQDRFVERVGGSRPHRIDVRIVAATNRHLADLVAKGHFRLDLYYRLTGVEVHVPPLRARRADIPELVETILGRHGAERPRRVSRAALEALASYDWPGNVRELERALERAVALADDEEIGVADLPPSVTRHFTEVLGPALAAHDTLRDLAARYVRLVLDRCRDRKRLACRQLGISYHTLQAHLRRLPGETWSPPTGVVDGDTPGGPRQSALRGPGPEAPSGHHDDDVAAPSPIEKVVRRPQRAQTARARAPA